MTNSQPPPRPGAWPIEHPVDLDTLEQDHTDQQAEQEYGERYAEYWSAVARNELAFNIAQLGTAIWEKQ